jgi:hypothetical protein
LKLLESSRPEDNPLRRAAVLRFSEGVVKLIDEQTFHGLMQNWPPREAGLEALQVNLNLNFSLELICNGNLGALCLRCDVQVYLPSAGSAGTMYRNSYRIVNDKVLL